jgi:hypothetical protein
MSYAILRVEKIKTMAGVGSAVAHNRRTSAESAPQADPSKTHMNIVVAGGPADEIVSVFKQKIEACGKHRKDAVLALELVITASPDFFQNKTDAQAKEWIDASHDWLKRAFGADNIVDLVLHLDEKEPHLQALIVPIYNGKLRASAWLDGPKKMEDMQTSYHKAVEKFGLKRGEKKSKSDHTTLKSFYDLVKRIISGVNAGKVLPPELPQRNFLGRIDADDWEKFESDLEKYNRDTIDLRGQSIGSQLLIESSFSGEAGKRRDEAVKMAAEAMKRAKEADLKAAAALAVVAAQRKKFDDLEPALDDLEAKIARKTELLGTSELEQFRDKLRAEIAQLEAKKEALIEPEKPVRERFIG